MDLSYRFSVNSMYNDVNKYNDFDTKMPVVPDYVLMKLDELTRKNLLIAAYILLIIAFFGNVAALIVTFKRQIQPLFQICLISLACSDILTCSFIITTYISQLSIEYASLWTLGEILCGFSPFVTTTAIIVNSLSLVGIALDRYMVVTRVIQTWEPSKIFGVTVAILAWGFAAGTSSPMITSYYIENVIIAETDPTNQSSVINHFQAEMCIGDKESNKYFIAVLFSIIFLPIVCAFLWLNGVIAKEILQRRRPIVVESKGTMNSSSTECNSTDKKTTETNMSAKDITKQCTISNRDEKSATGNSTNGFLNGKRIKTNRETRQLRMFRVVVALMISFLICRMPTWVYLLYKQFAKSNVPVNWILHYSLGLLSVGNCVLNPLLYTFLSESIRYLTLISNGLRNTVFCK